MPEIDAAGLKKLIADATPYWAIPRDITGPTTPAIFGPTCGEQVVWRQYYDLPENERLKADMPKTAHNVLACGMDTLAIFVGPKREENRALVLALRNQAPALLSELERLTAENERMRAALKFAHDQLNCEPWLGYQEFGEAVRRAAAALAKDAT